MINESSPSELNISSLANEIHDSAWAESPVKPIGRAFLSKFLHRLESINEVEFITRCFLSFERSYCIALLLSAPELWEPLTLENWNRLAAEASPRPQVARFDVSGRYSDVEFFVKWLKLDYLTCAFENNLLSATDKSRIALYCESNAGSLTEYSDDRSDLDGVVLCSSDRLTAYRAKLIRACPALLPRFDNESSLQEYAHERLISCSLDVEE